MQNKLSGLSLAFRWSQIKPLPGKPLPRSRSRHSSCLHGDCIYMIGGKDGRVSLKDIWKFCLETSEWERLTFKGDSLSYLEGHSLVSYKKNLLLFGGSFGDDVTDSALWILNPDVLHVRQISCEPGFPQPSTRRHHSAVVHEGVMYVYGGYIDLKGSSSEFWAFHISEEEWELIQPRQHRSDMPEGRQGHSAVLHGRNMWIYGGLSGLTPKSDLWYYNFHVGKWTRMKCRFGPPALVGHAAAVVKDNMILQGGEQNGELRNDFWIFSFGCLKWTHVEIPNQVPSPRMWHSLEAITLVSKTTDSSTRTSSMPYLQNKHRKRQNLRPRSSPAYSSARNRVMPKLNKENLTVNSENVSVSSQKPQSESQPMKNQLNVNPFIKEVSTTPKGSVQRPSSIELQNIRTRSDSVPMRTLALQTNTVELQTIKPRADSIPVVMRTPTTKQKEEKSPLLLERHISQCSEGSQSSLKGADNLGMDISSSSDGLSSLDVTSCQAFTQSYGYHQKPPERVKPVKMQTFSHNVINVLPYPQLTQDLVVEDLEIYENYFSELNETAFVKRECQRNRFGGFNKKYKVNKMEIKHLQKRSSGYSTNDVTLDRCRSSSVGELHSLREKVSETKTNVRSKSLHNLRKDSPILCWQSEDADHTNEEDREDPATNVEMTTNFSEPVNKETFHEHKVVSYKNTPPTKRQEENQELAQPYLLLFGGKDMKGGSVWLESLTAWRCEVFVRHSDISHGEFHKSSLIV